MGSRRASWLAVVLGVALAGCSGSKGGSSGSTGSSAASGSGTSGTSGHASSGSSGASTGGTTGSGTARVCETCASDGDCASAHCTLDGQGAGACASAEPCTSSADCGGLACDTSSGSCTCRPPGQLTPCTSDARFCDPGQVCSTVTDNNPVCHCTLGTDGGADSCAANTNGATICDPFSLACRAPQSQEPCGPSSGCVGGASCVNGTCSQACTTDDDCYIVGQHCSNGTCALALCGPTVTNVGYYQSCDFDFDAGYACACMPRSASDGGLYGVCIHAGGGAPGDACGDGSVVERCGKGSRCVIGGASGQLATCEAECNAASTGDPTQTDDVVCPQASAACTPDLASDGGIVPGLCTGTSDAGFSVAAHDAWPQVPQHGTASLGSVHAVMITWADDPSRAAYDDYVAAISANSTWLAVGAEYGALTSYTSSTYHDPGNTPGTSQSPINDSTTQQYIAGLIDSGKVPPATTGMFYLVSIDAAANWYDSSLGGGVCTGAAGYHGVFTHGGASVPYSVIFDCSVGLHFNQDTITHELFEAATDWDGQDGYVLWDYSDPWTLQGGELADMCDDDVLTDVYDAQGNAFARVWSNAAARTDGSPCVPNPPSLIFAGMSTNPSRVVNVTSNGSAQVATFTVRGWTNQAMGGFYAVPYLLDGLNVLPSMSTDVLANGQSAVLSVPVPANARNGDYISVGISAYALDGGPLDNAEWRAEVDIQ